MCISAFEAERVNPRKSGEIDAVNWTPDPALLAPGEMLIEGGICRGVYTGDDVQRKHE